METFAGVMCISIIFFALYKGCCKKEVHVCDDKEKDISYNSLEEYIDNLNKLKKRLDIIEDMITDMEICVPNEHEKNVTVKWIGKNGETRKYNFWVSGENLNTELILKMAYSEREKLRSLLAKEISFFKERSNENCYENYKNLSRRGDYR